MAHDKTTPHDHFVFSKKSAFMQRICDLVRTGHVQYVQGHVSIDKARLLVDKFESRFAISTQKLAASRIRKAGGSTSRLLLLKQQSDDSNLVWILLHQAGRVPEISEKWRDAIFDRIALTGYELVRQTKPEEPKPVWTWRYTRSRHEELCEAIRLSIRQKRDQDLNQLIHTISRTPGFAGARSQVKKLKELIESEWKRTRGVKETMPKFPDRIGYIRRIADVGMKLSTLRKIALTDKKPIPAELNGSQATLRSARFTKDDSAMNKTIDGYSDYTRISDLTKEVIDRLASKVQGRMQETAPHKLVGAAAHEWLSSFLVWPQPIFMCQRPADMVRTETGLAEVIRAIEAWPSDIFQV